MRRRPSAPPPTPRAAHHFAEAELRRRKDDPIDAAGLLAFGERMPWRPWTPPRPEQNALRGLARQIQAFTRQRAAAKNQRHAAAATRLTPAALLQALDDHIAHLDAMIAGLRHAARDLTADAPDLARRCDLADRLPGIDRATALTLTAELGGLPDDMTARQWTAQAGLDVREERSGTSLHKRARISKRGNARIRAALYYPAMSAVRCCPQARRFYLRLTQRGLAKRQALTAVMRKLLHGLHALWKTGEAFDPDKLFPDVQPQNP